MQKHIYGACKGADSQGNALKCKREEEDQGKNRTPEKGNVRPIAMMEMLSVINKIKIKDVKIR